jgi:hypothetical protein
VRPFVRRSRADGYWYVDTSADDSTPYPGTAWGGYDTLPEAFAAALAAKIMEPA